MRPEALRIQVTHLFLDLFNVLFVLLLIGTRLLKLLLQCWNLFRSIDEATCWMSCCVRWI